VFVIGGFLLLILVPIILMAFGMPYWLVITLFSLIGVTGATMYIISVYDRRRAIRRNYEFNARVGEFAPTVEELAEIAEAEAQAASEAQTEKPKTKEQQRRNPFHPWTEPAFWPRMFEEQMAEMFRRLGYRVILTPYQGDHGIDLKVINPTEYAIVQCKRYAQRNKVGEEYVREFFGCMQHESADIGYMITTSDFTDNAYKWAKGKRIVLINEEWLRDMLRETEHLAQVGGASVG